MSATGSRKSRTMTSVVTVLTVLLVTGHVGQARAAVGKRVEPASGPSDPLTVTLVVAEVDGALGVVSANEGGFIPPGDGGTDIGYSDGTLFVEAGEPGSLRLVNEPGTTTIGRRVRCAWHAVGGSAFQPTWDITEPTIPEPGRLYVLRCFYPDDNSELTGYPMLVVHNPADPVAGAAIDVVEVAKFAVDSIAFEVPSPVLSPPGRQLVGVETWLGVASRLDYRDVAAQAGNTWVSVHPVLRDSAWNLGDGSMVRCSEDIAKLWDPTIAPSSQATRCSHTFEKVSGPTPLTGTIDVSWTIYELTDAHPSTWTIWGVVTRRAPIGFDIGELQSAIR